MTVTVQANVKDQVGSLYNIKSEGDEPDVVWTDFGAILQAIDPSLPQQVRSNLAAALIRQWEAPPAPSAPAQAPPAPSGAWGNPPVPPMQQSAPQLPAAAQPSAPGAAPSCYHGVKEYISGTAKTGRTWQAWACPADRNDPTKCEKEWIR